MDELKAEIVETIERWADRYGVEDLPAPDNLAHCIANIPTIAEALKLRQLVKAGALVNAGTKVGHSISTNQPG